MSQTIMFFFHPSLKYLGLSMGMLRKQCSLQKSVNLCMRMHIYVYVCMRTSCARPGARYEVQGNARSLHGFLEVPRVLWFSFGSVMCQGWGILLLSFWQFMSFVRQRFGWFGPEKHEEDILDWRLAKHLPIIVLYHSNNINRKWCLIVFNSK